MLHRFIALFLAVIFGLSIILWKPASTSNPAASPEDRAKEDLSRFDYPSQRSIKWQAHFLMPHESLERLFGDDWVYVARFNRLDRRHAYPGVTIKVPLNLREARNYEPLPLFYGPAKDHSKYILIDVTEQWLGTYEYGKLRFSMPAITGIEGHLTPLGMFKIDARHRKHTSSLYKTAKGDAQYPMDYALRFFVDEKYVTYWIHARDMPGRPASHGCIGIYDEEMQKRVYKVPEKPVLKDAQRLFFWVCDNREDPPGIVPIEDGPLVEIRGNLPNYLAFSRN